MDASGVIFGLLSMLGFGLSNSLAPVPVRELGDKRVLFLRGVFVSAILLSVLLLTGQAAFSSVYTPIAIVISFIAYLPLVTFLKALKVGKLGIVTPVANSSMIFTILFSMLFFGEALTLNHALSVLMIIAGIVLVSVNLKDIRHSQLFRMSSGLPFALITCFLWGLVFFLFKIPVSTLGPIMTSFMIEGGIMVFGGIALGATGGSFKLPSKRMLAYVFLVALFGAAGTLFYNIGIAASGVGMVYALSSSNPLVSVIYGRLVYKERLARMQWFAVLIMLAGITTLAYF